MDTGLNAWIIVGICLLGGTIVSVVLGFVLTFLSRDIKYDPSPADVTYEADYIDAEVIDDADAEDYPYEDISEVVRDI